MPTEIVIGNGGQLRAVYSDGLRRLLPKELQPKAIARRASHVEMIQEGPRAGTWFIDFSPLGTGYEFCLLETYWDRVPALEAEVAWLKKNWLSGDRDESDPRTADGD